MKDVEKTFNIHIVCLNVATLRRWQARENVYSDIKINTQQRNVHFQE